MSKNEKTLMFVISSILSKREAISFAKNMNGGDKWYIICVQRNPKARDVYRREGYVVVRDVRENEVVKGCFALWADRENLLAVNE